MMCPGCDRFRPWDDHECVMRADIHEPDPDLIPEGATRP